MNRHDAASSRMALKRKLKDREIIDVDLLARQLIINPASYINNIPILFNLLTPDSAKASRAIISLQNFFTSVLPLISSPTASENCSSWLRSKFRKYLISLFRLVHSQKAQNSMGMIPLDVLMEFVQLGDEGNFHYSIYFKLLHDIVHSVSDCDDIVLDSLATMYFKYTDVRYFTYIIIGKLSRALEDKDRSTTGAVDGTSECRSRTELATLKLHKLLSRIPVLKSSDNMSDCEMWSCSGTFTKKGNTQVHSNLEGSTQVQSLEPNDMLATSQIVAKKMRSRLTEAWTSFLRLHLPLHVHQEVLEKLCQDVVPYLSNPLILCDFLTRSYDIRGVVSVMALKNIHFLMAQHGLIYSNFHQKVYDVLEPSVLTGNGCAMLFSLVDTCLRSPLPENFAAAFYEKLNELALRVPHAAENISALIHKLRLRNPSVNCLAPLEPCSHSTRAMLKLEKKSIETTENNSSVPKDSVSG